MASREIKFRAWSPRMKIMLPWETIEHTTAGLILTETSANKPMQFTGLKDKNGVEIYEGDIVSLEGNMTADDSLGLLPNGWTFDGSDRFAVEWGSDLAGWVLRTETKPDSPYNTKYLNHARSLLVGGNVIVVGNIFENPAELAEVQHHENNH